MDNLINITDILSILSYIVGNSTYNELEYLTADVNEDNNISILDIIHIINIILGNRGEDATFVQFENQNTSLNIISNGIIGGIQMTISHSENFEFKLNENHFVSDYKTTGNQTELIIIAPENGELISANSKFEIDKFESFSSKGKINSILSHIPDFHIGIYPNPFNPITEITFNIQKDSFIDIEIFDINGKVVFSQMDKFYNSGNHNLLWDASLNPSGLYILKINSNDIVKSAKLMLIK